MADPETLARREWLAVNGAGAFAASTVAGGAARRYHALLVAALEPPAGRRMLLGDLDATLHLHGETLALSTHVYADGTIFPDGFQRLQSFAADPIPTWTYSLPGGGTLTRQLFFARGANTVFITFHLEGAGDAALTLAPLTADKTFHHEQRRHDLPHLLSEADGKGWAVRLHADGPTLRMLCQGGQWSDAGWWNERLFHATENARGFDCLEDLFCPATVTAPLKDGATLCFTATAEKGATPSWRDALAEARRRDRALIAGGNDRTGRALRRAADAFVVETSARATILAGYPWFGDWGRDTFIALPGLLLTTRRFDTARRILLDFVPFLRDGRIPNRFPDVGDEPAYNNIDATLWFVRACRLYADAAADRAFLDTIRTTVLAIVDAHQAGTVGDGIRADGDGLLRGGGPETNLTWMDAKIGGWSVTPRFGKPVEVNALWVDALNFAATFDAGRRTDADRALSRFVTAFRRPDGLGLWDVLGADDRPDPAIRPNMVLAAAVLGTRLPSETQAAVLETAERYLLTPYGLRTLAPHDPAYRPRYEGDGPARDSAYHQGTVWPWLIGAYVDLVRLVRGPHVDVRPLLASLVAHLDDGGVGGISEIFDADPPHRPNGCPWQAWSVAEVLRVR